VADAKPSTEVIVALSCESRDAVNRIADKRPTPQIAPAPAHFALAPAQY
jgi:predicted lactoylglutathione lyase